MEKKEGDERILRFSTTWRRLQNDCSKMFKISPDETLKIVQELYEKKLVTYPQDRCQSPLHGSGKGDTEKYRRAEKL